MNLWSYILQSTEPGLGNTAMLVIFISIFGMIGGIALVVLPREFAKIGRRSLVLTIKRSGERSVN